MLSFHNHRPDFAPAFIALLISVSCCACQNSTGMAPSEGEPDHSLDAYIAQDTAQFLCKYSRGSFPNWPMWPEFEAWLKPEEAEAIIEISDRFVTQKPPAHRAKYRAIARFIANHTTCEPAPDQDGKLPLRDKTGAIGIRFIQHTPIVPNIPDIPADPQRSELDTEYAWLQGFDKAFDGTTYENKINIVLEQDENQRFVMRSNITNAYAIPLEIRDFWEKLDQYKLDDAFEFVSIACLRNADSCFELRPYWAAAQRFQAAAASEFSQNVRISDTKMKTVALTGSSAYTALEMTLQNTGPHAYTDIIFKTDEVTPQFCTLQSERTKLDSPATELPPGQTRKAWCILNADTRPWTKTDIHIATPIYSNSISE